MRLYSRTYGFSFSCTCVVACCCRVLVFVLSRFVDVYLCCRVLLTRICLCRLRTCILLSRMLTCVLCSTSSPVLDCHLVSLINLHVCMYVCRRQSRRYPNLSPIKKLVMLLMFGKNRQLWRNFTLAIWCCMDKNDLKSALAPPTLEQFLRLCMRHSRRHRTPPGRTGGSLAGTGGPPVGTGRPASGR